MNRRIVDGIELPIEAFNYRWFVLDYGSDWVHRMDPERPSAALCGRDWLDPWWEDDWEPYNYKSCSRCLAKLREIRDTAAAGPEARRLQAERRALKNAQAEAAISQISRPKKRKKTPTAQQLASMTPLARQKALAKMQQRAVELDTGGRTRRGSFIVSGGLPTLGKRR